MKGCRSCGAVQLDPVLSLGRTPLANALLKEDELSKPEAPFPLDLVFCPSCALVQITETVPPAQLFSHYLYMSSLSDTMLAHAAQPARSLTPERGVGANSLVIQVA